MRYGYLSCLLFYLGICFPGTIYAQADGHNVHEISLEELLSVKISTATKYEQTISEAPASVTIITSEDIERYGFQTLEEVFRSVRGFYVSNDRTYSYLGVRGFSRPTDYNNRILLLLNGHTINENIFGGAAIGTELGLDLDIIDRIEIVRGPGSALYGTGAMFAVVNIITKNGNMVDDLKFSAATGSYGKLQGSAVFGKEFDNGLDVLISGQWADIKGQDLYYEEYDDPSTNNGLAEGLDRDKYYGLLTIIPYGEFTLQGMMTSREKGVPTAPFGTVFNGDDAKTLDKRKFIELKYDHEMDSDKNVMLRGYFDDFDKIASFPYLIEFGNFSEIVHGTGAFDGIWLGSEVQFRWDIRSNNRLTIGAEYQKQLRASYDIQSGDSLLVHLDFPFTVVSVYLQDEYQVAENLSLTFGIRRDQYSTVGSSITPRVAVIYNPIKSGTLKLLYGEAFRVPNVFELIFGEPIPAAKANPALKPEKITIGEVIWEQRLSDELFGIVSFYNYKMKDLIDQTIDPSDFLRQFQNISRVKARGLELGLNARLKMGLWGYLSYTFQHAEDADLKEKLTNSPSHIVRMGFSYPVMKHFYAATELLYETDRRTVYGTKTDPYLLTNFKLSSKLLFNHVKFSLQIRNLFDVTYKTPGGFEHLQDSITQNGRNFDVKLEYKL
jgi:iron complex outermembrane receptor protein